MFVLLALACADTENPEETNPEEVITTVRLDFGSGGSFSWSDPENDGNPAVDVIQLADASAFTLRVSFLNELEDPAEDITEEVDAESDQHQIFFTGSAVEGPATGDNAAAVLTQAYADQDAAGFPVGLENEVATVLAGSGVLTVTLRHLPPVDGEPVKTGSLAEDVASGGTAALPGETDVSVDFDVVVG